MSLAAAAVVASMPLLGGVHLDADAQGRGLLTWSGYRGNRYVTQVADLATGRKRELWDSRSVSIMELSDSTSRRPAPRWRASATERARTRRRGG